MRWLWNILPILIVIMVAIIAMAVGMYFEKRRREAIAKVAEELGLEFYPSGITDLLAALKGFRLVSSGDSHALANTIRGVTDDVELTIFDLSYSTGSGKNRSTHRQTVIRFQSPKLTLPEFAISPENFFHKIGKLFGMKDINFAEDARFSSAFLLNGSDETAVRGVFAPEVRAWFSGRTGITAEGRGNQLLYFRAGSRSKATEIPKLLEEGFSLYSLLTKNGA